MSRAVLSTRARARVYIFLFCFDYQVIALGGVVDERIQTTALISSA